MVGTIQRGVYEKLGVRRIINGVGLVTRYGGSVMPPEVVEAMAEASRSYVDTGRAATQRWGGYRALHRCRGRLRLRRSRRGASPGDRGVRRRDRPGEDPPAAGHDRHEERDHHAQVAA